MAHIRMLGGDQRSRELYHLLRAQYPEHSIETMGLWEDEGPYRAGEADLWILPFPSFRGNPPRTPTANGVMGWTMEEAAGMLHPGCRAAGLLLPGHRRILELCPGVEWTDLAGHESYQQKNAVLTAEGAVALVSGEGGEAMWRRRVLVAGFGRIGRILARYLDAMGAVVTVAVRREASRAEAEAAGFCAVMPDGLESAASECRVIFNTVPSPIFTPSVVGSMAVDAVYIELASPPYGADPAVLKMRGILRLCYPGIPGMRYPRTAAAILMDELEPMLNSLK